VSAAAAAAVRAGGGGLGYAPTASSSGGGGSGSGTGSGSNSGTRMERTGSGAYGGTAMRALPQRQTDGGLGGMGGIGVAGGENAPSAPPPPAYEAFEQPATPYGQQRQRRVISVYGDGHCMFRSIASAVMPSLQNLPRNSFGIIIDRNNRDKEKEAALELRKQTADYMEQHWDQFPFVDVDERSKLVRGIRGSEWGGEEALVSLVHVTRRPITVIKKSIMRKGEPEETTYRQDFTNDADMIFIRYSRNEDHAIASGNPEAGGHYDLLV